MSEINCPSTTNLVEPTTPEPDISTWLGHSPLINASGCLCATNKMLDELRAGGPAGICTKSCTLNPREGNPEPRYWEHDDGMMTLNSMGLPNLGVDYYLDYFKTREYDGWRCISLAVLGPIEDTYTMLSKIIQPGSPVDAIEFNLSCPNLEGKEIIAYDKPALQELLFSLEDCCQKLINCSVAEMDAYADNKKPGYEIGQSEYKPPEFGIKLPPYWQLSDYREIAQMLNPNWISFIHTVNSVPNALVIDCEREETVIHPKQGFGGLGGEIIKPIALANVRGFYLAFQELGGGWDKIKIIGCGGVSTGQDVFEMILAGADAVSVGSQLLIEGPQCLARIADELQEILTKKGYRNLDEFRGRLKVKKAISS